MAGFYLSMKSIIKLVFKKIAIFSPPKSVKVAKNNYQNIDPCFVEIVQLMKIKKKTFSL
jgi:hypothetical protein